MATDMTASGSPEEKLRSVFELSKIQSKHVHCTHPCVAKRTTSKAFKIFFRNVRKLLTEMYDDVQRDGR